MGQGEGGVGGGVGGGGSGEDVWRLYPNFPSLLRENIPQHKNGEIFHVLGRMVRWGDQWGGDGEGEGGYPAGPGLQ